MLPDDLMGGYTSFSLEAESQTGLATHNATHQGAK